MAANKDLLALIDERLQAAFARETAAMCASLLGIAETFAQNDVRLAGIEAKLERPPLDLPSARAQQLIALLDQRIKAALEREQRALAEATSDVVRNVLREFIDEFKQVRGEVEAKLLQLQTLLAERAPVDPRPN